MESGTIVFNTINYIKGRKGGSKSSGSAPAIRTTPDNLRSKDTVEVILALGEGPWKGLTNGAKSFYIGDTQLQNESGEYNFPTFELNFFPGTDDDDFIVPVLGGQASNKVVNTNLSSGVPITRQTDSGQIDYIDVRLVFPRLYGADSTGTYNNTITFRIETKALSSATWTKAFGEDITLFGKTTSNYVKDFRIPVARINEPYEIRLTKISVESDNVYFQDMNWESFQEIIAGQKQYPNTACIQLVGQASDQFSSIPQWKGVFDCLMVKVPTNYDPVTRTYSGVWDGTWKIAWTDNPAWCFYDYVMNNRYGIANYYPEVNLDKYDVYEAAQWCDEMVPDGKGGLQPRYTFNLNITEARSGKELARYIAGAFNATFFDDLDSKAFLRVDKDEDACHIFTKEMVFDGQFNYSYTDITSWYNDITVSFVNPDLNWSDDRRRVYNQDLIDENGRIPLDFIAVGCNDAHEAVRRAQYKMITANTENCIVNFKTNRMGLFVNPFDVILICDPDMGYGISGRAKSIDASRQKVYLRTPVYLEANIPYTITFSLNDGSFLKTTLNSTAKGYNYELNINAVLPEELTPEKVVFTIEHATLLGTPRPFRVTKMEEVDGSPDQIMIEGININRNKWYDADNVTDSGVIDYSVLPSVFDPPGPASVGFLETFVKSDRSFHLTVSPYFDRGAYKYYDSNYPFEVWSRLKSEGGPFINRTLYLGDTIINHPAGLYEFKVLGKSYLGNVTRLETAPIWEFEVTNPLTPPTDIDWARTNNKEVYWGYSNPPNDFEGFQVRYHNQEARDTWDDAIRAHQGLLSATSFYTNLIPASARVILICAVDYFGVASANPAIIYRPLGDISGTNVVEQSDYHPFWSGTKIDCTIIAGELVSDDTGGLMYSGISTAKKYNGGNMYESTYKEMFYYDQFTTSADGYILIDIDFEGSGYEINIRDNASQPWQPVPERMFIQAGDYEFKLRVFGGKVRGIINSLSIINDVDDIEEDVQDITVDAGGFIRVPLTKTYRQIKIVNVIIQDDGINNPTSYRIVDKDPVLGPQIKLLDETGAVSAGLIDVTIKGF